MGCCECSAFTLFMISCCLFPLKLCFSAPLNRDAEFTIIRGQLRVVNKDERENHLIGLLVDEREKNERHVQEIKKMEEHQNDFHFKLSSYTFLRNTIESFTENYLQPCLSGSTGKPLRGRKDVLKAFDKFFDPGADKPEHVQRMANETLDFLRSANISPEELIKTECAVYDECCIFICTYRKYCTANLKQSECDTLIRMAPQVDENVKSFLMFLNSRLPTKNDSRKS